MAGLSMDAPAQDASDTSDSIYGRNFGSDRSASADAGGPGTIMDMIIRHQEEREREAAELEELRRRNQELVEQMRREALAIDLIIAEAHARYADSACRLATETRILIDRQTAALRSHLAEIDAQCAAASTAEQVAALCQERRADVEAEIARLTALDAPPPEDCATEAPAHGAPTEEAE